MAPVAGAQAESQARCWNARPRWMRSGCLPSCGPLPSRFICCAKVSNMLRFYLDPRIDAAALEAAIAAELRRCLHTWVNNSTARHTDRSASPWNGQYRAVFEILARPQLREIARRVGNIVNRLSLGGCHNGGLFLKIIMNNGVPISPRLIAAILYGNWWGGKAGFQFLPRPGEYRIRAVCTLRRRPH